MRNLKMSYRRLPHRPWCCPGGEGNWREKHLAFAKAHAKDSPCAYVFLDECIIRSFDYRKFEWCLPSQSPTPIDNLQHTASCHVFGAIGTNGFRLLVNFADYSTESRGGVTSTDYLRKGSRKSSFPHSGHFLATSTEGSHRVSDGEVDWVLKPYTPKQVHWGIKNERI